MSKKNRSYQAAVLVLSSIELHHHIKRQTVLLIDGVTYSSRVAMLIGIHKSTYLAFPNPNIQHRIDAIFTHAKLCR